MTQHIVDDVVAPVLAAYGIPHNGRKVETLASGLINKTWKVTVGDNVYILQRINHHVFKQPQNVADNIRMIADYLAHHDRNYIFTTPVKTLTHEEMVRDSQGGYFRLFPYIHGSQTIDIVQSPQQAFEAAQQFGKFTKRLSAFDATRLRTTIPDFHNLTLRYAQFEKSLDSGNKDRINESAHLIREIRQHRDILDIFESLHQNQNIKKRVTHHDTKISNVLFDNNNKGICVIDLDTVMPGYFISDVGDMMRTYLSPVSEEEKDFTRIAIRHDFFRAIVQGYVGEMREELSGDEQELILYSGTFLVYMQALRFLTDYFNNDIYYGIHYPEQNFVRAGNQLQLLKLMYAEKENLERIVAAELKK